MAIPSKVLPGFSASLWMQVIASPTVLSTANLSVWALQVGGIVGFSANGTGINTGTATGTTTAVVLSAGVATDDIYNNNLLYVNGEYRVIVDYVGSTKTATVAAFSAAPSGTYYVYSGIQVPVQAIPAFGQDDAVANFSVAGSRQSDKIPTQAPGTSLTITASWNPADTALLQIRADAYSGVVDRTFVIAAVDGTNTVAYAFNGRVAQFQIDAQPGAEAKCAFTIHPRANQYGWSNN